NYQYTTHFLAGELVSGTNASSPGDAELDLPHHRPPDFGSSIALIHLPRHRSVEVALFLF
ncbi:MAG: hypothetical protein VX475_06215, partial [Myxococcota bacterium]|nr:hypothetical protein [Myxococcota bacterium]